MINEISISGFKSLSNFSISLKSGLNVLVGPNGAGKTNFLKFLEFISELSSTNVTSAVSRVGGASQIFHREPSGELNNTISFNIKGRGFTSRRHRVPDSRRENQVIDIVYELNIEIRLGDNGVFFSRQSINVSRSRSKRDAVSDISVHWILDENNDGNIVVERASAHLLDDYILTKNKSSQETLKSILADARQDFRDHFILQYLNIFIDSLRVISSDLTYGRAYNFNPAKVRESEDIAREPSVDWDGGGVAASLYALKNVRRQRNGPYYGVGIFEGRVKYSDIGYKQVEDYLRLANSDIASIDAQNDTLENKIRVVMNFGAPEGIEGLPIALLSDGTVKWLALITAVVMGGERFCIEEPENFLHPRLQQEAVRILRARCEAGAGGRHAILTTHSETLLNALFAEEIIVFNNDKGSTIAARPENANEIDELINDTGFGLGYFYFTGSLS